jgi:hypothetical protein
MPGRQMLTSVLPTHLGEALLTRSLKVAAVLVVAFTLNRLARWMVRRLVRSLQQQQVQQRLASIRAKTPRALRSTEPLPSLRRSQRADAIGALVRNLSSVVIWLVASAWILQILGVQLGPLVAGAGFVGLAIAISAQQMVTDFLAGIAMLLEDEYGVGDVIDVGPATGEVERVGLRTTQLRAVDGTVWHVRNGEIDASATSRATGAGSCWTLRWPGAPICRWRPAPWTMQPRSCPRTSGGGRGCWRSPRSGAWRGWDRRRPRSGSASRRVRPSVMRWPASCGPGWTRRSSRPGSGRRPAPRRRDPTPEPTHTSRSAGTRWRLNCPT